MSKFEVNMSIKTKITACLQNTENEHLRDGGYFVANKVGLTISVFC